MKSTLPVFACLLATAACSAQWQLIDDFQQWEDGDIITEAADIGWNSYFDRESPNHGDGEYWFLADPYEPDNKAIFFGFPNFGGRVTYYLFALKNLPAGGVGVNEKGTLYFRTMFAGNCIAWNMGTADRSYAIDSNTGEVLDEIGWDDFNALFRITYENSIEHYDGTEYVAVDPYIETDFYEWYKFYMVLDNSWDDALAQPVSTGSFKLFRQGPDDLEPILIRVGTSPSKEAAAFRRTPKDDDGNPQAIRWVMFATAGDPFLGLGCPDPLLLDDFYFSNGENLTDPTIFNPWGDPIWVHEGKDVNTGPFLGWLNVTQAPYIWSYALNGWIYMEEPAADAPGAWGYFFK